MILFEFLISILLCTVIGYFFFLSGPADEEDNPNHDHATVSKFPFNLLDPNYWKSLCLPYVNQDTTLGFVLRTVLFFVTDDEAFGYDMYTGHEEVGRVSSDVYEEGRVVPRDVKRRRGHPHLEKGAKFAGVERRHAESANWVNTLLRLCAYLFLGGGSFLHEVYVDRVRYGAEKCIRKVNSRFDVHPPPPQNPDAGGWTSTKAMCMKKCLLQLLHLEMGKGFNLPNANNDGEGNSFMNAQGNDFPLPLNVEGDVMTASSRSTTALEDGYTNNNNNSSSQFGINFPRLAGDIISVEILPGAVGDLVPHSATTPLAPIAAASNASKRSRTTKIATVSSTTSPLLPSEKSTVLETPITRPLRCFTIPLLYEDSQFFLQLGCSLPLFALLNLGKKDPNNATQIPIPGDVLRLDCQLNVKRILFHGSLYVSFSGNVFELSFPHQPQFTIKLEVTPPSSSDNNLVIASEREVGVSPFTATSTMRNTVSPPNNEERNGVVFSAQASHAAPSVRTFQPRGRSLNNVKKSCINERNEKMEEILFLSVQNAVKSVTYPNVIQGKMSFDRSIAWSKTKATLPLHT